MARSSFRLCLILAARSDESNGWPMPADRLVFDTALADAGAACSLEDKAGRFVMGTSAIVGRACKLAGGSLLRVRLQGAAPLGGNFGDNTGSRHLRRIIHPAMSSNPSRDTLPRPIMRAEKGKVLPGWCAPWLV